MGQVLKFEPAAKGKKYPQKNRYRVLYIVIDKEKDSVVIQK